MKTPVLQVCLLLITLASADFVEGCRFNVRETGFVDLGTGSFLLICLTEGDSQGNFAGMFRDRAGEVLADTNVLFEHVDISTQTDHPALRFVEEHGIVSFPAVVLLSPTGHSLSMATDSLSDSQHQRIASTLSETVDSPLRNLLVKDLSRVYGVVLLIEGEEEAENIRARQQAEIAIGQIEAHMGFMPKEISHGPVLRTLERESIYAERVLLWSLGLNGVELSEPRVAVLYGRGRWIGPLLTGEEIREQILFNILSVIGADCECGLDPRLIRGTALPVRWNRERQNEVTRDLGFDPDNPMIKIEVSQILKLRGTLYPTASSPDRAAVDDLPVPFVVDPEAGPLIKNVLLAFCGSVALALVVGLIMFRRVKRVN